MSSIEIRLLRLVRFAAAIANARHARIELADGGVAFSHGDAAAGASEWRAPLVPGVVLVVVGLPAQLDTSHLEALGDIADEIALALAERDTLRDEQWETALDCAQHSVWVFRNSGGRFMYSPVWKGLLGYGPDELGDDVQTWEGLMHPDDVRPAHDAFAAYLRNDVPIYEAEYRIRCKDGSYRWMLARGRATQRDERDLVVVGTSTDITALRAIEERLRESELRLLESQRVAQVGHWEWTEGTEELVLTPETCRILGIAPGTTLTAATIVARLAAKDPASPFLRAIRGALKTQEATTLEHTVTVADGSRVTCRINVRHATRADGRKALFGTIQDISAEVASRLELERAKAAAESAARARSEFLATMSHEIRTPLNGVLGLTELLASTALDEEQRNYLQHARAAGKSLLGLLNDVLDFSKIEAGALIIELHPFASLALVDDAVSTVAERAQERGIDLWVDLQRDLPDLLIGDASRLRQIVVNLVGNAVKFTDHGEIEIFVGGHPAADDPTRWVLELSVRDTGIGIARDEHERVFEAFIQADGAARRQRGGTGLGLAISRRIARAMGGDITVSSVPGVGSTFTLRTPLQIDPEPAPFIILPTGMRALIIDQHRGSIALERSLVASGVLVLRGDPWAFGNPNAYPRDAADIVFVDAELAATATPSALRMLCESVGRHGRPAAIVAIADIRGRAHLDASRFAAVLSRPIRRGSLFEVIRRNAPVPSALAQPFPRLARPLRVLVAEDNLVNQFLVRQVLAKLECDIEIVADGQEAVARAKASTYDIILMDCVMPVMDGIEASQWIRTMDTRTPIIALTAGAIETDRQRCYEAGMDDYLSKPFEIGQLVRLLERWRDGRGN